MPTPTRATPPRFTIVSAVYDVGRCLDDFIASIENQTFPLDQVEVIMVDDGSTDGSPRILEQWRERRPDLVTILTKPNGGQASARNLGLDHARGEWVTFTDPDDMLEPNVLERVDTFLTDHPRTALVALNRVLLHDRTGRTGQHPLKRHFAREDRLRDLGDNPSFFYGSAPCAFFERAVVEQHAMRFSEVIKPSFEDGYFCDQYLMTVPKPLVGFIGTASYIYRKRADNTSTLNLGRTHVGRYTTVLEHAFIPLLRMAEERYGHVPHWLQTHIMYELSWLFGDEEANRRAFEIDDRLGDEINGLLAQIAAALDPMIIRSFDLRTFRPAWRDLLEHGFTGEQWHTPYVVIDRVDMRQKAVRVLYRYVGERPAEQVFVDGTPVRPHFEKDRALPYFGRTTLRERILWLPYGTLHVRLAGRDVEVRVEEPERPFIALEGWRARNVLNPGWVARKEAEDREAAAVSLRDRLLRRLAATKPVRRFFGAAWVLIDRIHDADDSAEHLFRYLRKHRRSINAWFVIERGTPHYRRLRNDGYLRVVPHGSLRWKLLMLNCNQLISSHADLPIMRPKEITRLTRPNWRFVFLQHGVTKDDLSSWLNPKDIDIFVVSTSAEYAAVAGDDTSYRYTARETQLTGLPRFDVLLDAAGAIKPEDRDLILVAPTWRQWLVSRVDQTTQQWTADVAEFRESEFARNWIGMLTSGRLTDVAKAHGLRIGLLMHPNQQHIVGHLGLPADIELLDYDHDVRRIFARARVLVTDYSSTAFNAAYIERPVVYFQFDRDAVLAGAHIGRRGYFDYYRDGFGPVTVTAEETVGAVEKAIAAGFEPEAEYLRRIEEAFPDRDGRCCERVADAIVAARGPKRQPSVTPDSDAAIGETELAVSEEMADESTVDPEVAAETGASDNL